MDLPCGETDEDDYSDTEFSRLYKQALWHDNIIFVEPKAVDQLRNINLAAYTDEKLKSIDEYYSTRDFAACNLTRLPAHNKVQLLRRLLDIFNRDLPPACTPLKAYDLTLKQALYDENEGVSVPDEIWQSYTQGRRTCKDKPTDRRSLIECIATLSKELFGKRFVEKIKTRKRSQSGKQVYNYKTNTVLLDIAIKLMTWQDRGEDIDSEFARLYGSDLSSLS